MTTKWGYSPVTVDRSPEDTPLETAEKLLDALTTAKAEYEENRRREEERRKKGFFGRLFS